MVMGHEAQQRACMKSVGQRSGGRVMRRQEFALSLFENDCALEDVETRGHRSVASGAGAAGLGKGLA